MARPNRGRSIGKEDNLAERIAYEREAAGLSYEALARKMTEAGCSIQGSAIYKVEKGSPRRRVTVDELVAFADVFGVSVENLLTPIDLLKREWAELRLKNLNEATKTLSDACSGMLDVWFDIYRHDIIDAFDQVDEEERVLTYMDNISPQFVEALPDSALGDIVGALRDRLLRRLAMKLAIAEVRDALPDGVELVAREEEDGNGKH